MVISFSSGANKQKYLVFVFVAAVLITFLILRQKPSQEIVLENFAQEAYNLNKNKININFEALNSSILQNLSSFEGFQVYPDAKGVPLSPSFSWGAATGAETYVFEIVGFFSTTTKNTFFNFSDDAEKLQPSKNYVWRVKACNNDMSYCSAWNNNCDTGKEFGCWRFSTVSSDIFSLSSPLNNAKGVPLSPSFSWGAATGAETYVFEIVGFFSTTTKNTFFNFSDDAEKLQPSKNYVWRVKACNNDMSYCSAWNSRSFATMNLLAWPKLNQPSISEVSIGRDNPFIAY